MNYVEAILFLKHLFKKTKNYFKFNIIIKKNSIC